MSVRRKAMRGPRGAAALVSVVVVVSGALGLASPAQATSEVARYGNNWGRSIGVNEDLIVACDGEDDGKNAFTQYHVGNAAPGTYWTVWDTDGPNNGCITKDLTNTPYFARAIRVCEPTSGDPVCGGWKYTDGLGGS